VQRSKVERLGLKCVCVCLNVCGDGEVGGLAGASGREVEQNMLVYQ
jgi:hypothetical protein